MNLLWVVLLLAASPRPVFAQLSQKGDECLKKADTQYEMDVCANEEAKRAGTELNLVYAHLLAIAKADPAAVAKIKRLESISSDYLNAYLEATYPAEDKQTAYGTVFPMEADLLRAKLTRQQTQALNETVQHLGELYGQSGPPASKAIGVKPQ